MKSLSTSSLLLGCDIYKNEGSLEKNLQEIRQIFSAVNTSYGPLGLDKMCVSASGEVLITNDGATILKNMLLSSSTAKLLVNLALEQDKEVGDGTTTVVLLATFLIEKGFELIKAGVHASTVVNGYRLAYNESVRYIKDRMSFNVEHGNREQEAVSAKIVDSLIRTSIASKMINEEAELFVGLINKCISGSGSFDSVNVIKLVGGSMADSTFYPGFVLNCSLASPLMESYASMRSIPCLLLDLSLNIVKMPLSVNISSTPEEIEAIREKEISLTKDRCSFLINSGARLILVTGGIDELFVKRFVDNGVVAVKRVSRFDLERIAKATGGDIHRTIDQGMCGAASNSDGLSAAISPFVVDGTRLLAFPNSFSCLLLEIPSSTILIKGPNCQVVEEVDRSLNDAIQVIKRALKNKSVLPGGGTVESTLYFVLEEFSNDLNLKEHVAIHRYSESLLELVKLLCTNAGLDSGKHVGKLLKAQKESRFVRNKFVGLDVVTGTVQNNLEYGIVEPTVYKLKALKSATEAAISILRINEIIVFN